MGLDNFSDYGSGTSMDSTKSWASQEPWPVFKSGLEEHKQKSSSFLDLVMGHCTVEDALEEFRLNGSDSPYNPDEDKVWGINKYHTDSLIGMGPSSVYLRQKSWPEPERTPAAQLPSPRARWAPTVSEFIPAPQQTKHEEPMDTTPQAPTSQPDMITQEQLQVLASLPNGVLYSLLRGLEQGRGANMKGKVKRQPEQECRFCKNNGERESYYRGHALKEGGRVACPVLRAFVCRRCGASGDTAHTIKYCPLSTNEERMKSTAMMRSVRMASGRRRGLASSTPEYVMFGAASPSAAIDSNVYTAYTETAPLDPLWAALEQKLML